MKKRIFIFCLIMLMLPFAFGSFLENNSKVFAEDSTTQFNITYITTSHEILQQDYIDAYALTTNSNNEEYIASYSNNGGNYPGNVLSRAFDLNFNTFWETNKVNSNTYKNYVQIEFNTEVSVNRLVFATRRDDKLKGFPLTATFYISNDGTNFDKIGIGVSELNSGVLLYNFDKVYTFKYFKFEYTDVNANLTQHCSCSEFVFYKPEEQVLLEARNLFTDYKKSVLSSQYSSLNAINNLETQINSLSYIPSSVQENIERAKAILNGEITFDTKYREFLTNFETNNKHIKQVGNIYNYARNDLDMVWQGTNRQATGIYAKPNEVLKIYVQADELDPLPQLVFTQHQGYWNQWKSGNYTLQRGENTITVPSLYNASWSVKTLAGGPIYLINPYTTLEQSQNVKVYIEGGTVFPIFYMDEDEIRYEKNLRDYIDLLNANPDTYLNLTEIVSNNVILTVQASRAYDFYITQNLSVQKVCENWDNYLKGLYTFEGVSFDKDSEHYDERANYLNVNIRIMQPYAAAYAYTEHVGIQTNNWQDTALIGQNFGWGMTHELGHMMDISERVVSETTNNMVSNFNKSANEKTGSRENHTTIRNLMAPDDVDPNTVWKNNSGNAAIWWNIESIFPGYWGKLENLYRYSTANGMNKVEKQVYYSSIATGIDLSYYFERYGYNLGGTMFVEESASTSFKTAMQKLHDDNVIVDNELKLWYVDNMTYTYYLEYGEKLSIYNDSMKVNIISVEKTNSGYNILLPYKNNVAHLGYEILEGNENDGYKVIGFTSGNYFTDTRTYDEKYSPSYKVRAFDRRLNCTAYSDLYTNESTKSVCRIDGEYFTSIKDAILNANSGDTIYLLDDIKENGIIADKNITIEIDPSIKNDITFCKISSSNIFTVNTSCSLSIIGNDTNKIIFEGYNVSFSQRAIVSNGTLSLSNIVFQNFTSNISAGGVLYLASGTANIQNTQFLNNKANDNGGAITTSNSVTLTIENCTFKNNTVSGNGGAMELKCKTTVTNSTFFSNKANSAGAFISNENTQTFSNCNFELNSSSGFGGVCFAYGTVSFNDCTLKNNSSSYAGIVYGQSYSSTTLTNCKLTNNSASTEGATVYSNQNSTIKINNCDIYNNTSKKGDVLYLNNGTIILNVDKNKIEGEMFVNTSKVIQLNGDVSNMNITLNTGDKEFDSTIVKNNIEFNEDFNNNIKISNKLASKYALYLSDNKKEIKLTKATYQIGITVADNTTIIDKIFTYGDTYVLPEVNLMPKYEFISWQYNGQSYNAGDTITINSNTNIVANLNQLLFNLKIKIDNQTILSNNVYADEDIISLSTLLENKKYNIIGWYYAGDNYTINDSIIFDKNYDEITAILDEKVDTPTTTNPQSPQNSFILIVIICSCVVIFIILILLFILIKKNKNKNK